MNESPTTVVYLKKTKHFSGSQINFQRGTLEKHLGEGAPGSPFRCPRGTRRHSQYPVPGAFTPAGAHSATSAGVSPVQPSRTVLEPVRGPRLYSLTHSEAAQLCRLRRQKASGVSVTLGRQFPGVASRGQVSMCDPQAGSELQEPVRLGFPD